MANRPKKRTATAETKSNTFLDALKFCSLVVKDTGPPNETHVILNNNWVTAFNGILAIGCPIQEDIYACPHNQTLINALSKCGENLSITQLDNNRLSIKSNKFKAVVPCLEQSLLSVSIPDQPIAVIDDRFKEALESVSGLITDDIYRVVTASILMNGSSIVSTTGTVIFEYWHGIDLPSGLAIPKAVIKPLVQCSKKLARFGFSQSSVTFYYENGSWLRSQLYADQWPDIRGILDRPSNPFPIPADFWQGLAALQPFTEGLIYFDADVMRSHATGDQGASYEVPGLPPGPIYPAKQLALIKGYADQIDFLCQWDNNYCLYFYGKQIRGIIAGVKG